MGLASGPGSREIHALIYCSCSASASVLAGSLVVHGVSWDVGCQLLFVIYSSVFTAFIFQRCALPDTTVLKSPSLCTSPVRWHLLRIECHRWNLACTYLRLVFGLFLPPPFIMFFFKHTLISRLFLAFSVLSYFAWSTQGHHAALDVVLICWHRLLFTDFSCNFKKARQKSSVVKFLNGSGASYRSDSGSTGSGYEKRVLKIPAPAPHYYTSTVIRCCCCG